MNIRKIRQLRNFTQDYLASQIGITQAGLSKIEKGETKISYDLLELISQILDVSVISLISFDKFGCFDPGNPKDVKRTYLLFENDNKIQRLILDKINLLENLLLLTENELKIYKEKYGDL